MSKHIHIISFDIPYPADYGGVIDVFYKIKAFHKAGIKIHLHCFEYGRERTNELNKYCTEVNYYKRKTGIKANISTSPYIIKSRISKELEDKLQEDNYPILCEGMHTCGIIDNKELITNRKIIYRAANVEHHYYKALYNSENNAVKKAYYLSEAVKLEKWQAKLDNVDLILTLSEKDKEHYVSAFPNIKTINTFLFFNSDKELQPNFENKEKYILFHAKLSVHENIEAALHIINHIAPNVNAKFIIAGINPDKSIYDAARPVDNIEVIANLSEEAMQSLLNNAHINILITKQETGLKLKLINSLYQSKYIIANKEMLSGSGLNECVDIANSDEDIINKTNELLQNEFTISDYTNRLNLIPREYNNDIQIERIIREIYSNE